MGKVFVRIPSCKGKKQYPPSHAKALAKKLTEQKGKDYRAYWCEETNAHWHVGVKRGHIGRINEPHNTCDKCGREIRVKRWLKHLAKCEGYNEENPPPIPLNNLEKENK